jgi:predicted GTPase
MNRIRTLILGAAGRDFHNFNVMYRDDERYDVVGFTAAQIPNITDRRYPPSLAGPYYPDGIPIYDEARLSGLIASLNVRQAVFSYSDVSYQYLMHRGAIVNAAGADFVLPGPRQTMLTGTKPVVSVCAVRTGAGKSQTSRRVAHLLRSRGRNAVVVRHPMPYGDLAAQRVQRFATLADLDRHHCTIEEIEEYEPHIVSGSVVYAGVDYAAIRRQAEAEADVIVWDGGNNDFPFYRPELHIVVADPLRLGNELTYYPGEANLRMADVVVINKIDSATPEDTAALRRHISAANPRASIVLANSPVVADRPELVTGRRVLVVEDGPTTTHGEMRFGAGTVAARRLGASEIVDPRPYAVGSIVETFATYPGIGQLLPAMGYGERQVRDLEATIANTPCDTVIVGTPIDLTRLVKIRQAVVRVAYELHEVGLPSLEQLIGEFVARVEPVRT